MFKSLFEWLTSTQPIHNWLLLIMLLGLIVSGSKASKNAVKNKGE